MKAIMISIQPKWVEKILNSEKTIEIRKTCPIRFKDLKPYECAEPIDVYIYCTKSDIKGARENFTFEQLKLLGKVVAKFTLNKVREITYDSTYKMFKLNDLLQNSCLDAKQLFSYLKGKVGYAWHISNLEIFDKPKELSEFANIHVIEANGIKLEIGYEMERPPQSWCYVEVEE